jgi:hypothetical protein
MFGVGLASLVGAGVNVGVAGNQSVVAVGLAVRVEVGVISGAGSAWGAQAANRITISTSNAHLRGDIAPIIASPHRRTH